MFSTEEFESQQYAAQGLLKPGEFLTPELLQQLREADGGRMQFFAYINGFMQIDTATLRPEQAELLRGEIADVFLHTYFTRNSGQPQLIGLLDSLGSNLVEPIEGF